MGALVPCRRRDRQCCSPFEGPRETCGAAAAGSPRRATGRCAVGCRPERRSMSIPPGLPAIGVIRQTRRRAYGDMGRRRLGLRRARRLRDRRQGHGARSVRGRPRPGGVGGAGHAPATARRAGRDTDRDRAAVRPVGRCPGRGGLRRHPDPSQRGQGLPAPLPGRRRQERPGRRLHPGRHPAHRRPPPAPARAPVRRHQSPARPGARPRRPGRHAGRPGPPADRPAGELLARRRPHLQRSRQPDRARLSRALSDARSGRAPRAQAPGRLPRPAPLLRAPLP